MYIHQNQLANLRKSIKPNRAIIILGPRRTGKTTLLKKFLEDIKEEVFFINGEDITARQNLESQSIEKLKAFIGKYRWLAIDEAQKINQIGLNLKLIVDHIEGIRVIATGSSAFDLAKKVGEPLTGRKVTLKLFPLSQIELSQNENPLQTKSKLENRLIYGTYPQIVLSRDNHEKELLLKEIISSYLYRDILELDEIQHSAKIISLLQLLAFQIGKEVSLIELGTQLGLNRKTVEKYLDLLEKSFVILSVRGFSRNLRKEITKTGRYYFYDNGIRNGLINNFNSLNLRNDVGALWENYIVMERIKKQEYTPIYANNFFWRTYDQKEIDWVEQREGKLFGYEIKWGTKIPKAPKLWTDTYPEVSWQVVNQENYLDFIL